MSAVHHLDRKSLASVLVALSIASLIILSSVGRTSAAPTGANFDHIVSIAMENRDYANVLGDGTPSGCPSGTAPFLCSLLPLSSTIPNYHSYCIGSSDPAYASAGTLVNPPCSAACYTAVTSGATYRSTDGLIKGSISATNNFDRLSSGDSWLKSFLIGSGSITSPASGSLLSSGLFTNPSFHTLLWIWWDEYDPSPNIQYGPMISKGFISASNNWDEYSQLRMIENNWGLPTLSYDAQSPVMTDRLGTGGPQALSASFTYTSLSPATGAVVGFSGIAAGGKAPYSFSWSFGDGASATGASATHAFSKTGTYSVTVTVTDSNSSTSTSTRQVTVSNSLPTITYLYIGLIAGGAISIGVFLAKYHSRNRRLAAELRSPRQPAQAPAQNPERKRKFPSRDFEDLSDFGFVVARV